MSTPNKSHQVAAKRVLGYLKGTIILVLMCLNAMNKKRTRLTQYSGNGWCRDKVDTRSTYGYVLLYNEASIF